MSYSHTEAKNEFFAAVEAADENGDYKALRSLANDAAGRDDNELADALMQMAARHQAPEEDDWAYDRYIDEKLTDELS